MDSSIFITATGTDIGKTYVSSRLVKRMLNNGIDCEYFKPVMSGTAELQPNDCQYVQQISGARVHVSYCFEPAVSPHLAAQFAGVQIEKEKIAGDFVRISCNNSVVVVEGAGGIFTPLGDNLTQTDIIKMLGLDVIIVADSGLGTINSTILTVDYTRRCGIRIKGIILNRYNADNVVHADNKTQIEKYTGVNVIECFGNGI
jgi:dethiobiotin synthetase